ncbi:MAG: Ni/Fe hydrogenase subunit alpha [Candidatus Thermoplasmatota archaeon]|nr:Ni/Fe hydrogenase subunit alpha [Candidatus Thermoplasmatota archaeon]
MSENPNQLEVHHITRVEGHGRIIIDVKDRKLEKVELNIIEGSRLFESWLRGRRLDEVPHLVSRICAICSAGHTAAALKAIEDASGIHASETAVKLRDLATMGEFIQSHTLHMYCLALPDFLGFESVIAMAGKLPNEVKLALKMKKLGNDIAQVATGRAVNQISMNVKGFSRVPTKEELQGLLAKLKEMRPFAEKSCDIFAGLNYPNFQRKTEYIALHTPKEYALYDGKIKSSEGWKAPVSEWEQKATEQVVAYSNAKQGVRNGHGYLAGPLARMNLNQKQLLDAAKAKLDAGPIKFPSYNTFHSNYARAIELLHCFDKCIAIIEDLIATGAEKGKVDYKEYALLAKKFSANKGYGAVEVPRGTLYHSYAIDENGIVTYANVLTPTAQNLRNIEEDMVAYLPQLMDKTREEICHAAEMTVRAYDPCISCATHFLEVEFKD